MRSQPIQGYRVFKSKRNTELTSLIVAPISAIDGLREDDVGK